MLQRPHRVYGLKLSSWVLTGSDETVFIRGSGMERLGQLANKYRVNIPGSQTLRKQQLLRQRPERSTKNCRSG